MVHSKETAEEQLLRIIEGSQSDRTPAESPKGPSFLMSLKARLDNFAAGLRGGLVPRPRGRFKEDPFLWNLRLANRLLWVVLLGLTAYVGSEVMRIQADSAAPPPITAKVPEAPVVVVDPVEPESPVKPLAEYLTAVMEKNPFQTASEPDGTQDLAPVPETTQTRIQDLTRGLMVVGIDRGAHPVAFVENIDEKRTYLVGIGDKLNGMVVKAIGTEGVLLTYEGEEILLP